MIRTSAKMSLIFATLVCLVHVLAAEGYSRENLSIRRFLHGCPFAFPCPPPPCDNPVFGPHDCCGSCPEPETTTAAANTLKKRSLLLKNSYIDAQGVSFLRKISRKSAPSELDFLRQIWRTTTFPTTTYCPNPCTHHGHRYCHPLPCYIRCVDAVKPAGACCYECPNGPNCSHEGRVIPEGQNVTLASGDVAFCSHGDLYGGNVQVYKVLG